MTESVVSCRGLARIVRRPRGKPGGSPTAALFLDAALGEGCMVYGDQFKDTPENREQMKHAAETYADMKGIHYIVTRAKADGKLAAIPKSMFDPEREEIIFECSGGGQKAADERWEDIFRRLSEQADSPEDEGNQDGVGN